MNSPLNFQSSFEILSLSVFSSLADERLCDTIEIVSIER